MGGEWQIVGERFEDTANTKRLGGYVLDKLNVEYRLEKDWSLFVHANNIFDKQYELQKDYATLGTNVFVSIRYQPK